MGYSPKHAKPVSLRGTTIKTPLSGGPGGAGGRHRAGPRIPAPRIAGDSAIPAAPGPVSGADAAPEPGAQAPETAGDTQAARAEALMRLVPLQRSPLPES
ncbi:MAG: hypothetical protein FWE35_10100 [Streptosporangiales bacterium]|nr:hypothetical protein [Streptosporangiales bacterium]